VTALVQDRISVCICTFKRPELLDRLLRALEQQVIDETFAFDVVVVDNDAGRSAEPTVSACRQRGTLHLTYDCEPEQNISLTRNRAVRNATGNLIAFIDDDEAPVAGWLASLHRTLTTYAADGVLGPVIAEFGPGTPEWIQRGPFFHRRRLATGTGISAKDARTGNLLLRRSIFADGEVWFDPAFGRTGGEDSDFFWRRSRTGRRFVWCDEAAAYEVVPPERCTASYHVKRYLRSGTLDGERMRAGRLASQGAIARNAVIFCGCAAIAPFTLVLRKHISTRVFQKMAYCSGILTAYYGLSLLRYRD
jgi:glycosyltransferase involved in cell wall biosynthesis